MGKSATYIRKFSLTIEVARFYPDTFRPPCYALFMRVCEALFEQLLNACVHTHIVYYKNNNLLFTLKYEHFFKDKQLALCTLHLYNVFCNI